MTKPKEGPSLRQIRIATRVAAAENVRIEDDEIKGQWVKDTLQRFYGLPQASLLELFVNHSSSDEAIVRFTRQFGPLFLKSTKHESKFGPGALRIPQTGDGTIREWDFPVERWRMWQKVFRESWQEIIETGGPTGWQYETLEAEQFAFVDGRYEFVARDLQRFLELQLFCTPSNRFRICRKYLEDEKRQQKKDQVENPCETPYFITADLKQVYCSPRCSEWAQGQWKKQWWTKVGKPRRQQKRKQQSTSGRPTKESRARRKERRR